MGGCSATEIELTMRAGDVDLPATLTLPGGGIRAGVVAVHGAANPECSYFQYEHLSDVGSAAGIAVLRYDRRPSTSGDGIALQVQAEDALAVVRLLADTSTEHPWGCGVGNPTQSRSAVRTPTD